MFWGVSRVLIGLAITGAILSFASAGLHELRAQTPPPGSKAIKGDELKKLVSDKTWVVQSQANLFVYNTADGKRILKRPNGQIDQGGVWRITADDKFCTKFPSVRNNAESCDVVYIRGDGTYLFLETDFAVEDGDSRKVK